MAYSGTADLNWHHKEVVLLDMKWVDKVIVLHVEVRQFEEEAHQGIEPAVALSRVSDGKQDNILVVSGRKNKNILVSLGPGDRLLGHINQQNPNSAGTVKWEIVA